MQRLISPEDMQKCEKAYFENSGVPSIDVMKRAAKALQDVILRHYPHAKRIYFACGPGGNGGDGYACASLMHTPDRIVRIFEAGQSKHADAVSCREFALRRGIPIGDDMDSEPDVWVDCLYGTGLSRAPEGEAARLIERMNASPAKVVAADIPSGLNGRTGVAYEPCVQADVTVTFQLTKYGHRLNDGLDKCGRLIVADVGFPETIFPPEMPMLFAPEDLRGLFDARPRNSYKNRFGHLLIVAGSVGMAGAAALCTKAALRSGVGLVTVACVEEIVPIIQALAPCAMCIPLPQQDGHIAESALPLLKKAFAGKTAIAIGPGLTRQVAPGIIQSVLESSLPTVIDADALNIIAENPGLKQYLGANHIITPHPGEAARLLGRKLIEPMADGRDLARMSVTAVLKGASRVISGGNELAVSASGSCAMAKGGSGDVLTGILGAIVAEPSDRTHFANALCACEIHGLCGELAAQKYGVRAANAADLIEFLPEVLKKYVE